MRKPRVLIADDHRMMAEGLRSLLEPEFDLVGIVADGRSLVAAAKKHRPDVIIADVTMPLLNGIEAAVQIRQSRVPARIVFLTMHRDIAYARRALKAGALGFVLKHSAPGELVKAIREALGGKTYVSPMIAGELLRSYQEEPPQGPDTDRCLTPRQREVLQLVAEGRSAKEVAAVLHISTRTAEFHRARIMQALGLQTTAELVQYAIRTGIISVWPERGAAQSAIEVS
jgi:DNA-binding NarL/FixJ family response regulator